MKNFGIKKCCFLAAACVLPCITLAGCASVKVDNDNVSVDVGDVDVDVNVGDGENGGVSVDVGDVETGSVSVDVGDVDTGDVSVNSENTNIGDVSVDVKTGYEGGRSEEIMDFSDSFGDLNGCAVIYLPEKNKYTYYNKEMCEEQVSPFSTFKIAATLMGLKYGAVESADTKLGYDGKDYSEQWNKDLTLKEAYKVSCVWYYRKLIDAVGESNVQKELDDLSYGNCDISEWKGKDGDSYPELSGFWLNSSLKISPEEQVMVLNKIFNGESGFEQKHIEILKDIMKADTKTDADIYGKTGTGKKGIGWYTGYFVKDDITNYFAVYIDDDRQKNVTGYDAKDVLEKIIRNHY